ncbi:ABC transporter permease [Zeaxanthinibacter enoshimensis]|uniref:Putative ABC transport system permease protein n=1 Tax=Zeaxanthinibacter enoshimensis TaxID=392009 RepID=A0A4R6TKK3_9FLAO|nr:FtsX-like permease family protein [Zeaxanthinibacter enoshimensis]TDQ31474.1 putative ABC transport system permease protein [Zeaxanthinibacter enoshimensis]
MSWKEKIISKAGFFWLIKMAWRDGRASQGKLFLFMASIVIGITAVVSIQSFSDSLKSNIDLQSKSLIGADYIIDSSSPVNQRVQEVIDSLGGTAGEEINFASMVMFTQSGLSKLMKVRGITDGFPFYGKLETRPGWAADDFKKHGGALVDATVMLQYNLKRGDSIKIGNITLPIAGALKSVPGGSALASTVAPPVLIPHEVIEETGLIQLGSRIAYEYYFVAENENMDMEVLEDQLDAMLDAEGADLDTHTATSRSLGRRYGNFTRFLNLVAFIALLLGCIGIASSIHIYMNEKLTSVAVLKCLGATRIQTFVIFLLQITAMGFLGSVIGTLAGLLLQLFFPLLLDDFLPVDMVVRLSYPAVFTGLLLGLSMSVLFALLPLMGTLRVVPLQALRIEAQGPVRAKRVRVLILFLIFLAIYLFSLRMLENWIYAFFFVLGLVIAFSALAGVAYLFVKGIQNFFPENWSFCARQSMRNLSRPRNQTLTMILAIGVGTFLISTLYFTKDMLLARATIDRTSESPNLLLLDIQTDQTRLVSQSLEQQDLVVMENIPIVTMRVHSVKGRESKELRDDPDSKVGRWVLNHEFRTTYRDSLIGSESIVQGEWIGKYDSTGIVPISVAENFASDANVQVGDMVTFNVMGVILPTRVASIREVDWGRMQLNFSVVFPGNVLEQAPQFHVMTTKTMDEEASARIQQEIVMKYPNVSVIDLRQILDTVENILDRIGWVINFISFFSIITGIIVLIGAVRTSRLQRIKESVLLRTLGASGKQITKIVALEYLYLGILGSLSGILLSLLGSELLARFAFETTFIPSWIPFVVLFPAITVVVVLIGITNSRSVLQSPPLEVLRREVR